MLNITKRFPGVTALDNVSLTVKPGTVHALVGENGAGKSTLMKCLFGIYHPDEGEIILQGENVNIENSSQALKLGISMVHQELNQVSTLKVMENIWLGRFPMKNPLVINDQKMYQDTKDLFDQYSIKVDPKAKLGTLSVSDRQMVEIAKAASYNSKVIVMDEPTSSLSEKEVGHLFEVINRLRAGGASIIYISHKMEEIFQIADEITVLRDGKLIDTRPVKDVTFDELITLMVGRQLSNRFPKKTNTPGEVMLEVEHLKLTYSPLVEDVSFQVRKGEILGISGLEGSMRSEIVEGIFGYRTKTSGVIKKNGQVMDMKTPKDSIKNGFALLTEERKYNGIFGGMSVRDNSIMSNIAAYCLPGGVLNGKKIDKDVDWVIKSMSVKTPTTKTKIRSLSGGNQQKVLLGKWLLTSPDVLLLDEPTRGIDVGAKYEIYQLIIDLANQGKAVVFISSEMPELLGISDRIMVMSNGKVAGTVETKDTNQEELLRLAAKYI